MSLFEQAFDPEQRLAIKEMVAEYVQEKHATELSELADVVQDLVQAQVRTEARVDQLVQAQVRTEAQIDQLTQRMDELAQAQVRTETAVRDLARQLGGLSENLGGGLEDLSYEVVPYVLDKELGLVLGDLGRKYIDTGEELMEFNIYGEGIYREGPIRTVIVLREVKTNITGKELSHFAAQVERVRPHLTEAEVIPLFFGFRARPDVQDLARARGINLIFSYGKLFPAA